ncbi:MAG: OmpA family protein [Gammaproteobacteria bacterium]
MRNATSPPTMANVPSPRVNLRSKQALSGQSTTKWAPLHSLLLAVTLSVATLASHAVEPTNMAIKVNLFPGSDEMAQSFTEFERHTVALSVPQETAEGFFSEKTQDLEGRVYRRSFFVPAANGSAIEVFTNYRDAFAGRGLQTLFECQRSDCGGGRSAWSKPLDTTLATNVEKEQQFYLVAKLPSPETWVALFVKGLPGWGTEYMLDIIEPKALVTDRVSISVDDMIAALDRTGKVAIYDIFFDTGKSELKTQSDPVLANIATLLSQRGALSLYVVGHTDDTGRLELNRGLSEQRAQAVVDALVERGVARRRLLAFGAGPFAPAATNRDDGGRATNRRVELVERLTTD